MIKSKGIFAVSFIAMMVAGGAYANIASQGYVDQQIGTRAPAGNYATKTELNAKQNASTAVEVATAGTAVGDATHPVYVNAGGVATKIDKVAAAETADTATTADSATKATQDAAGNVITTTYATKTELNAKQNASTAVEVATAGTAVGDATHPIYVNASGVATKIDKVAAAATADTATTADSATKATQDAAGNVIADTYATKAEIPDEITVDAALSTDSTNPVQNKVVKAALDKKLENTATGTGSLSTGGATPATAANTVVIGDAASGAAASVVVGQSAKSSEAGLMSVAVGANASANDREAVAIGSNANVAGQGVAIGTMAKTTVAYGTAVGYRAETGAGTAVAIGQSATSTALGAIQLGSGTNSTEGTFNVGFGANKNYQLLDNDGKIPDERMPDTVLTNTATSESSFATGGGNAGDYATATIIGKNAMTAASGGTVYGSSAMASGGGGTAIGAAASAVQNAVALGTVAKGDGLNSVALGTAAVAQAEYAIQLGKGTNSESQTLSVGLGNTTSENYTLLKADGTIPAERMPDTVLTNTATGTDSFAVGNNSGALGQNSVAVGVDAKGEGALGIAIGSGATVEANGSIAIGASAKATAPSAIQLGRGTNSEGGTFKVRNYTMLGANGKIPGERLQISVGSATEPTGYADIWIE